VIDPTHELSLTRQAQLLQLSRASLYYEPVAATAADLQLMRRLDELHLQWPFLGSRMLRDIWRPEGIVAGRRHVATLMRKMGIEALYRRSNTSRRHPRHLIYPYLLRKLVIDRPNQVRATDLYPDGPWLRVSGGRHGLVQPQSLELARLQQHDRGLLRRGTGGSDRQVRAA